MISSKQPPGWRYVALVEQGRKFGLRLPVTYSEFGPMALKAARLDSATKTSGLTLKAAMETGQLLEDWRNTQETRGKKR